MSDSCVWRAAIDDRFGAHFVREGEWTTVLYMDGPEWCVWISLPGEERNVATNKTKLSRVIEIAPEFREEAIGMTQAALAQERATLARCLSDGLAALAAEDDERANAVLDDLRTWGTRDLRDELAEVGE